MAHSDSRLWKWLVYSGTVALLLGLFLLGRIYLPLLTQEITYDLKHLSIGSVSVPAAVPAEVVPPDPAFSLYIPKISALAPIVRNVDPYDSAVYQRQLTLGVAHARGSDLPGGTGNIFLFAHSVGNPLEASRFNAVFYLISKLTPGDRIIIWYLGQKYFYQVTESRFVSPGQVDYLSGASQKPRLTLMTCWPPGTTLRRLLILAEPVSPASNSVISP